MALPLKQKRLKKLIIVAACPSLVALTVILLLARRLAVSASYAEFHGGFGVTPVAGTPLGYAIAWMNAVLATSVTLTVRRMLKISRAESIKDR